jgi:hypothetical protein
MKVQPKKINHLDREGYALLATAIFALVGTIMGYAFFAMSASENKGSTYRRESTQAFYLADGALERARAKLLEDRAWRDGWNGEALGNGTYDLALRDTTYEGETGVVKLMASGHVGRAHRHLEALVKIPPSALALGLFVGDDAEVDGDLCLEGRAHVGGQADFGRNDENLECGGTCSSAFAITPPAVRTEPAAYPNTTYYFVLGDRGSKKYIGRIFDQYGNEFTDRADNQMRDVVSYNKGKDLFTFDFDSASLIEKYFDDQDGVFRREPGDAAVVVNFGEPSLLDSGQNDRADVILDGNNSSVINATIINCRFLGVSDAQRLDPDYWFGGETDFKQVDFRPMNSLAVIAHTFVKNGDNRTRVGTQELPALIYVTDEIPDLEDDLEVFGAILTLGDFDCDGDLTITPGEGLMAALPDYFSTAWDEGVSGTMEIINWVEGSPSGH